MSRTVAGLPGGREAASAEGVLLIADALSFAAHKHRDQRRKDAAATPYINHPIALFHLLSVEASISDPVVLCAALLHDTLEDTHTTAEELEARFGPGIRGVVLELTDDKSLAKAERKRRQVIHAARASRPARLVKLADKTCNLRDITASPPLGWGRTRCCEYFDWAGEVVAQIRGTHARLEALFDEVYARRPSD